MYKHGIFWLNRRLLRLIKNFFHMQGLVPAWNKIHCWGTQSTSRSVNHDIIEVVSSLQQLMGSNNFLSRTDLNLCRFLYVCLSLCLCQPIYLSLSVSDCLSVSQSIYLISYLLLIVCLSTCLFPHIVHPISLPLLLSSDISFSGTRWRVVKNVWAIFCFPEIKNVKNHQRVIFVCN